MIDRAATRKSAGDPSAALEKLADAAFLPDVLVFADNDGVRISPEEENDLALGNLYVIRFAPEEAKEILSMFAV